MFNFELSALYDEAGTIIKDAIMTLVQNPEQPFVLVQLSKDGEHYKGIANSSIEDAISLTLSLVQQYTKQYGDVWLETLKEGLDAES